MKNFIGIKIEIFTWAKIYLTFEKKIMIILLNYF
jgi:hypothetical protein